jgi:hypothetical protein
MVASPLVGRRRAVLMRGADRRYPDWRPRSAGAVAQGRFSPPDISQVRATDQPVLPPRRKRRTGHTCIGVVPTDAGAPASSILAARPGTIASAGHGGDTPYKVLHLRTWPAPAKSGRPTPAAQTTEHRTCSRRGRTSTAARPSWVQGRTGPVMTTSSSSSRESAPLSHARSLSGSPTSPATGDTIVSGMPVRARDRRRWTEADELARRCGCRCYRCQRPPAPGLPSLPAGPEACPEGCWGCAA